MQNQQQLRGRLWCIRLIALGRPSQQSVSCSFGFARENEEVEEREVEECRVVHAGVVQQGAVFEADDVAGLCTGDWLLAVHKHRIVAFGGAMERRTHRAEQWPVGVHFRRRETEARGGYE